MELPPIYASTPAELAEKILEVYRIWATSPEEYDSMAEIEWRAVVEKYSAELLTPVHERLFRASPSRQSSRIYIAVPSP